MSKGPHEAEAPNKHSTAVTFTAMDHSQVNSTPGPLVQGDPLDITGLHGPEPLVCPPNEERPQRPPPAPPDVICPRRSTAAKNPAYNYTRRYNRTHKALLMEGGDPRGTLDAMADNEEEPTYDDKDSRDKEALAQGDISESENEVITRRYGVGHAINAREVTTFLGEIIAIIRHQPRLLYGPMIRKAHKTLAMPGQVVSRAIANLTTLATLVISEEEEGRGPFIGASTAYFFLGLRDDTTLQGSSRL